MLLAIFIWIALSVVTVLVVVVVGVAFAGAAVAPLQAALLALPAFEQSYCRVAAAEAGDATKATGARNAKSNSVLASVLM